MMPYRTQGPVVDEETVAVPPSDAAQDETMPTLSKNKLKKIRRDQAWEEGREKRKELRKIRNKERKERKRAAADQNVPSQSPQGKRKAEDDAGSQVAKKPKHFKTIQLPISFVIDCGFDDLMLDGERKSLASQITRSYSDNCRAPFRSCLFVSSFGGHLKERYDTVLSGHHRNWKGIRFLEGDFEEAARQADELMKGDLGGKLAGAFKQIESTHPAEPDAEPGEVVYLTSDSPDTLTELKPYSTYIIGGIVDKNRHKGICYQRAMDRGMKTAKLPIGDYMKMTSRFVLATNHVVEIMLRWLELRDWAMAFLQVIPKRKGGNLKNGVEILSKSSTASTHDDEANDGPFEGDHTERETRDAGHPKGFDHNTAAKGTGA
ncbi:MAG: hypothetical protein LQ345_000201 [Seirophora villosa]|nr:MAG: hypothetical protein LQ345_000201 [Seirophora villosa]